MDYVELHGTGTPKGDPVEAEALGASMARGGPNSLAASGRSRPTSDISTPRRACSGLIKTALCIQHRELVPSLHFERRNPAIDLDRLKLKVQTRSSHGPVRTSLHRGGDVDRLRRHQCPRDPSRVERPRPRIRCPTNRATCSLSRPRATGRCRRSPRASPGGSREIEPPRLGDLAYTVATRRTHLDLRLAVTGDSPKAIGARLRAFLGGDGEAVATGSRRNRSAAARGVRVPGARPAVARHGPRSRPGQRHVRRGARGLRCARLSARRPGR